MLAIANMLAIAPIKVTQKASQVK